MTKRKIVLLTLLAIILLSTVSTLVMSATSNDVSLDVPTELIDKKSSAYKKFTSDMKKDEVVQEDVEYYSYFMYVLQPSAEEKQYIDKLIDKKYNIMALVKIFDFWRYTNEDISIIEKAYDYRPNDLTVSYWVDEAFIRLYKEGKSKTEYSNLSVEEVNEYIAQGITADELRAADKMSRKGVKTIEVILSERLQGKTWCEISNDIYGIELTDEEIEQLKSIEDPSEIIESVKLAQRTKGKIKDALKDSANGEWSGQKNREFKTKKMNEAKEILKKENLWDDSKKKTEKKAMFREEDLF